jgi:collagenase-like PrtC family protease
MSMKYFIMPADFKKETIDAYEKINRTCAHSRILETYGNVTLGMNFGSGRVLSQLPEVDLMDLQEFIRYSEQKKIGFNYTLNLSYMQNKEFTGEGISRIKEFLRLLREVGVRSLTVAMPSLLDFIRFADYDFKVKVSTICHITNANKARAYRNKGVERIVVDESVHRDFQTLKQIREAFGENVELIVNTMCHRNCIYRHFHYNETCGDSAGVANPVGVDYFEHKCMLQRYDSPAELLKLGWIRPEDLKYYTSIGYRLFKFQGRQHVENGNPLKALQHYIDEDYDGNLMELLDMFNTRYSFKVFLDNKKLEGFIKPYYEKENFCKNDCARCGYCEAFARKSIDYEKGLEVIHSAKTFYTEYDQYKEAIAAAAEATSLNMITEQTGSLETNVDFDLD